MKNVRNSRLLLYYSLLPSPRKTSLPEESALEYMTWAPITSKDCGSGSHNLPPLGLVWQQ